VFGHPIRSPILRRPEEYGLKYEEVVFPSMDGIPLEAWFFPADSDKLVIANHPLWFNSYGFPAHLEPWKQIGAAGGNDFEVNRSKVQYPATSRSPTSVQGRFYALAKTKKSCPSVRDEGVRSLSH